MRLSEIHIYQYELPVMNGPYTMANSQIHSVTTTLVKLVTDGGQVGWGETCPLGPAYAQAHAKGAVAALQELAPHLIGAPLALVPLHDIMDRHLDGHHYAKAAIDIAAHDALGKHLNMPVSALLGGALQSHVPSYFATGIGEPDEVAKLAAEKVAQGFKRLQLKVGGTHVERDIEMLHKVWELVRGKQIKLAIDANRGWTMRDVIHVSQACRHIPFVIEQPCHSLDELAQLAPRLCHPLYIDENSLSIDTVISALGQGIADGFGMKITRLGGLHPMSAFRDICHARHIPHSCDDSWGGDIIAAACTHMAATVSPALLEGVWIAAPYIDGSYDKSGAITIDKGRIAVPQGPGLGILPDESLFGAPITSL